MDCGCSVVQLCATGAAAQGSGERDALIAATALVHRLRIATRNVADFKPMGVEVVNPWDASH